MKFWLLRYLIVLTILPTPTYGSERRPPKTTKVLLSVESNTNHPLTLHGSIAYNFDINSKEHCFLHPFHSSLITLAREQKRPLGFTNLIEESSSEETNRHDMQFEVSTPASITQEQNIIKVTHPDHVSSLELNFRINESYQASSKEHFFSNFIPLPLEDCEKSTTVPQYKQEKPIQNLEVTLKKDNSGLEILHPQGLLPGWKTDSEGLFIFMSSHHRSKDFQIGEQNFRVNYHTEDFLSLVPTIKKTLFFMEKNFGKYPFNSLSINQTLSPLPPPKPGFISVNIPRQVLFSKVQESVLNWPHWVITANIISQWLGNHFSFSNHEDHWFLQGFITYLVRKALEENGSRINLFNSYETGLPWLQVNYHQIHEMLSFHQYRSKPKDALTYKDLRPTKESLQQNNLLFIKVSSALFQMESEIGQDRFLSLIHQYFKTNQSSISHLTFLDFLDTQANLSSEMRKRLKSNFRTWLTSTDWPDAGIAHIEQKTIDENSNVVSVFVEQSSSIQFPTTIKVTDTQGNEYFARTKATKNDVEEVKFLTRKPYEKVVIDPDHVIFDTNRFDNTTSYPGVNFFPGNARSLSDEDYTFFWVPYLYRHPSQPVSFGISSALFRYLSSSLFFKADFAPSENLSGYRARYLTSYPSLALDFEIIISKNFRDQQLTEVMLDRKKLIHRIPSFNAGIRVRHRFDFTDPSSQHYSLGLGFKFAPEFGQCASLIKGETEKAPKNSSKTLEYLRSTLITEHSCNISKKSLLNVRSFFGVLESKFEKLKSTLFYPSDIDEAKLRLDVGGLEPSSHLYSIGTDLLLPFQLPLPDDLLILSDRLKVRGFYDFGESFTPRNTYRAYGAGFLLPFGGDIVGGGNLILSRLSLLAVLFSKVNDKESRKVRLLFDVTGEL